MQFHLPTGVFGTWAVASLKDSLVAELRKDKTASTLTLYFYAITKSGWNEIRPSVKKWLSSRKRRSVTVFVGTDHAITDPLALHAMKRDGMIVRIMDQYQGVFHPKVVWLCGKDRNHVWVGSNNLTRNGLSKNIEFAVLVSSSDAPVELTKWARAVELGSSELTDDLLGSYERERNEFESHRAKSNATTFTWGRRLEPKTAAARKVKNGDLIVEVMPRETGLGGKQLQIPIAAARGFFGLKEAGSTKSIKLKASGTRDTRELTMTVFRNNTVRISVFDLEYRDRPCVIVFRTLASGLITYEIVSRSIFPTRYRLLLDLCGQQTRAGSRRWTIID